MEEIELSFKYEENEYVQACRQYLVESKTIKKSDLFIAVILFLLSLICIFLTSFRILGIILCVCAMVFLIALGSVYFVVPISTYKKNTKFKEGYQLNFSESSIKFKTDTINSQLKWDIYKDFYENEKFYYLIQQKQVYTIIPKRVFDDNLSKEQFKKMVISKLRLKGDV